MRIDQPYAFDAVQEVSLLVVDVAAGFGGVPVEVEPGRRAVHDPFDVGTLFR